MQPPTPATQPPSPEPQGDLSRFLVNDLAEAVTHEFNNVFNNILLQLEVLKRQGLSEQAASKAAGLQLRCREAATLLKNLQRFSETIQPAFQPVDLNQLVRTVASGNILGTRKEWARPIHLELDEELPPLLSFAFDLTRLVALLLEHATAVTPPSAGVTVRTGKSPDGCQLVVEDAGPGTGPSPDPTRKLLEPFAMARPGANDWALSVCKVLARRLRGSLRASNRSEVGMTFAIDFPAEQGSNTVQRPSAQTISQPEK